MSKKLLETPEKTVLYHLKNRSLAPLKFRFSGTKYDVSIDRLLSIRSKKERILYILRIGGWFSTYTEKDNYQCRVGARRSAQDIYRVYINYFDDIKDIFEIMRLLYQLAFEDRKISCHYCSTVRKYVFWLASSLGNGIHSQYDYNDLGVPFVNWERIGATGG